jgi:hypothetical protein
MRRPGTTATGSLQWPVPFDSGHEPVDQAVFQLAFLYGLANAEEAEVVAASRDLVGLFGQMLRPTGKMWVFFSLTARS